MPMGKGVHPAYKDSGIGSTDSAVVGALKRGIKRESAASDREVEKGIKDTVTGRNTTNVAKMGLASARETQAVNAEVNAEASVAEEARNRKKK